MPLLALILLAALPAACGGADEPPALVIPTSAATAAVSTVGSAQPTLPPATPTPAAPDATITLPPPPTVAPPLPTTTPDNRPPTVVPTATAQPTAASPVTAETTYRVAFVAADDVLNVRRRPDPNAAVLAELPPDTTGIRIIGEGQSVRGGSLWLPIETSAGDGWVNSRFLTEDISREAFCADPAVTELLSRLQTAVAEEDGRLLAELVHPDRGLRLRLNWWNPEVLVGGNDVRRLFSANERYDWGVEDGSGEPIRGPFRQVALPRLARDLVGATEWRCDEGLFGGTAGATILPDGYGSVRFYAAHRPAPPEQELDWGTWLVGIERWEGRYYVSYLVHYRWEI